MALTPATSSAPSPGGRIQRALVRLGDPRVTILLFVTFVLVRLPFRSEFLVNWDSVNFALGIENFDLGHHQPHAPGYIGYVWLGRLLFWITGNPNTGLVLMSVIAGAALPAVFYLLARRVLPHRSALLGAVLLGSSPVVWYYSVVALTYVVAAAITVAMVWAAHTARLDRSRLHLYLAVAMLAFLGAIRQTDFVLLIPALIYAAWVFPWRERFASAGALTAMTAIWMVPLMIAAGGPIAYIGRTRELAQLAGGRTWALGMNAVGMLQNVGLVGVGVVLGMSVALLAIPLAMLYRVKGTRRFDPQTRRLLYAWAAPALFTYLFIHTGQIGYVLMILPIIMLWVGGVVDAVRIERAARTGPVLPLSWTAAPRWATSVAMLALALANLAAFVGFPKASYALLSQGESDTVSDVANSLIDEDGGAGERTRQYNLPENDAYWSRATEFVENFSPNNTAILAVPASGGSFRHLAFYLPDYPVFGIGPDRTGAFGHLFTALHGFNDYTVDGLAEARPALRLPNNARWIIVPDRAIQERLPANLPQRAMEVADGPDLIAVHIPSNSALVFDQVTGDFRIQLTAAEDVAWVTPAGGSTASPSRPPRVTDAGSARTRRTSVRSVPPTSPDASCVRG